MDTLRAMSQSKTDRIFESLRQQIETGDLAEGAKLMSLRQASDRYGASKNVIVTVYDRLVAHGLARSQRGSGFYVARVAPTIAEPLFSSYPISIKLGLPSQVTSIMANF